MRVVAIVQNMNYCSWWRIEQPFRFLKDNGVDTEICWLDSDEMPLASIKDAIVVLHRILIKNGSIDDASVWINKLKKLGAKKIIYDLDDDVISENYVTHMKACGRASLNSLEQLESERQRQVRLIQLCDEVTVSTEALNRLISSITNAPIHVLPNSLNIEWYRRHLEDNPPHQNKYNNSLEQISIGWAGGLRPDADFAEMAEAWSYINKKYYTVRFIIGGYQPNILWNAVDYDKITRIPWANIEDWPKTMQVDIGCIPLAHNAFNNCKSPIKALEYTMAGALPIASPTVYNTSELPAMIIASGSGAWIHYLEDAIESYVYIMSVVEELQFEVQEHFDLSINWTKWCTAYES